MMRTVNYTGIHFWCTILNLTERYDVSILELYWSKYEYYYTSVMSDENSAGSIFISDCYPLNADECNIKFWTSTRVVSALTHGYYPTWLFILCAGLVSHLFNIFIPHTISSFSLSFVHIHLMSYFLLFFLIQTFIYLSYHYSSPLSFLLLLYIRTASLHLIFLSFIPFVLSPPFLLSTVFYFLYLFFSHIIFPFPSFPPSCHIKYSLGDL
jgi:hypothetical protein